LTFLQPFEKISLMEGQDVEGIPESVEIDDPAALATLYDPIRYRIFRTLETPRSMAELAEVVGRPANRLYYHVRLLVNAGLVRQVGTRASGRHTERIFGRAAPRMRFTGELQLGAPQGLLGAIAGELDAALARIADAAAPGTVSYHVVSLAPERAAELETRLRALVDEFESDRATGRGARTFGLLGALVPLDEKGDESGDP
jgi:DNA-binding transcriptional ArsR family regulator